MFLAKGKRGSEITCLQFPLTLVWATTIHKVQGLTLDKIVIDMKGGWFSRGQASVAFSCVQTLAGLHILKFNAKAIETNCCIHLSACQNSSSQTKRWTRKEDLLMCVTKQTTNWECRPREVSFCPQQLTTCRRAACDLSLCSV